MTRSTVRHAAGACLLLLCLTLACSSDSDDGSPRVPAGIVITPNQPRVAQGLSLKLKVQVVDATGREIPGKHPLITSGDESLLTVDQTGRVTSVGALGTVHLTADLDGLTGSVDVAIVQRIVSLTVVPDSVVLNQGLSTSLQVSLLDYLGIPASPYEALVFQSQNPGLVTVDINGTVVAGNTAGKTTITVRMDTLEAVVPVRVGIIPAEIIVNPSSVTLTASGTQQLTVQVKDQAGNIIPSPILNYSASNSAVFTVSSAGLVTSVGPNGGGVVRIQLENLEQDISVRVGPSPAALIVAHTTQTTQSMYEVDIGAGGQMVVSEPNAGVAVRGTLPGFDLPTSYSTSYLPLGVAVNHAGTRAYIGSTEKLSIINLANNTEVKSLPLGGGDKLAVVVSSDDKTAYVGTSLLVYRIDLTTNTVADSFQVNGSASFLALHPTQAKLYVSEGIVRELDLNTRKVTPFPGGNFVKDIGLSPDGSELYASSEGDGHLEVFSTATGRRIQSIQTTTGAFGLAASAKWIVVAGGGGVTIFDRASRLPISTLSVGGTPRRPAIDPGQTTIVVPNEAGWVDFIK